MKFITLVLSVSLLSFVPVLAVQAEVSPLAGHVVALDAGHGEIINGTEATGAVGWCDTSASIVTESELNRAVRAVLGEMLTDAGAVAYDVPQLASRSDRVAAAENEGQADVLISIHHNGSSDTSVDYTKAFVTQKNDKELALPVYNELTTAFGPGKGVKSDGYGMTVYGSLPGVLTESYFITNTKRACEVVAYTADTLNTNSIVHREAQAMFDGLTAYFSGQSSSGSGGGGGRGKSGR